MTRYLFRFFAVAAILAGQLLAGCAGVPGPKAPEVPAAAARDGSITLVDAMNRTVELTEPPQRIVVAGRASIMVINLIYLFPQAGDRVIGVTSGAQPPGRFLSLVDPDFGEKTMLARDAGPEQIAPLEPDLVLLRSFMAGELGNALETLGIPVVYVDPETPDAFLRDTATLGQLLGNQARADQIRSYYESRLAAVASRLQEEGPGDKPELLILQHSDKGGEIAFSVPPASWIQTAQVELAGGVPVWKDAVVGGGWTIVSFEQIAAWDPDFIYVVSYGTDAANIARSIETDQKWQQLSAVRASRLYGFAGDIYSWDQPDPRWILGVTWLAGKTYPRLFPELDMLQHTTEFFADMYGMDHAAIEEQILPSLKGDVP